MSTAPPSGPRTEAKIPAVLSSNPSRNSDLATDNGGEVGIAISPSSRLDARHTSPAIATVAPDVDVLVPDSVLDETVSFRLDDTLADIPRPELLKRMAAQASASGTAGALALEPPAANGPLDGYFYSVMKRTIDVAISAFLLVLLSPILLLSAVLVKLTDGGSIFYPHTRVGEGGNEFTCYKFRSMVVNAERMKSNLAFFNTHEDHRTFKIPNDPRVTWFGRIMRRTSIDELPQLWNVLKGEMSIVGPRPPVVTEVEQYTWDDMQRLTVKPGLTCIWQVSGRSRLPFPEQLKMDIEYIEKRSLALDLKLIALTVPAVLSADGAY
ncbi:MAG: sugar transferase [Planctomycetota bacterium]